MSLPVDTPTPAGDAPHHVVLLPVKPPARGKSRLVGLEDDARARLATAFALDTVAACRDARRVAQVLVATDDVAFARAVLALGCTALPDGVSGDLNGTLRQSAAEAGRRWPDLVPVALCADLPALRPTDLDAALSLTRPEQATFVADAAGVGTTLYSAPHDQFDPRFGPASRAAHDDAGALALPGDLASLRRDVDDLDDLRVALALGVGPRTAAVAVGLGLMPG